MFKLGHVPVTFALLVVNSKSPIEVPMLFVLRTITEVCMAGCAFLMHPHIPQVFKEHMGVRLGCSRASFVSIKIDE